MEAAAGRRRELVGLFVALTVIAQHGFQENGHF
jgi:hypothetical protein